MATFLPFYSGRYPFYVLRSVELPVGLMVLYDEASGEGQDLAEEFFETFLIFEV